MSLIFKSISQVMKSVGAIRKDQRNTHQNYKFRGIEDMYNGVQPALIANGVFCCPQVLKSETHEMQTKSGGTSFRVLLTVCHKFYAEDGSFVEVVTVGEGIDTSDKASNKAMSAAMKYAFIELLSIPTEDIEDSDRESPEAGSRRVVPQEPSWNDGVQNKDTGYKIPFGKFARRGLEEISIEDLRGYVEYIERKAEKDKKPITGQVLDFVDRASAHIAAFENGAINE